MKILLLDNYDSFTWNIYHYVQQVNENVDVVRNDEIELSRLNEYSHIILSPGPGLPSEAGKMPEVIRHTFYEKKILGICLGMQALAEFAGARLYNLDNVKHGVATACAIQKEDLLFAHLPGEITVGRYHSWAVDISSLPNELECIAVDHENVPMAIRHTSLPVRGVQFHPESVLTPDGFTIIKNWIQID